MSLEALSQTHSSLEGESVVVTGAGGFIGAHLVGALTRRGAEVHGCGRTRRSDDATWEVVDVADHAAVVDLVRRVRPRIVWHLAASAVGRADPDIVVPMFHTNAVGTLNVLDACRELDAVRVVLAGSMEEVQGGESPRTPYQASKSAAGLLADLYRETYGVDVRRLRIHMVYGPGERADTMLVPYVIESLLAGAAPQLRDGPRRVDWVYVDDVVDALIAAGTLEPPISRPVEVGTGIMTSVDDVVREIASHFDVDLELADAAHNGESRGGRAADVTTAHELLGWSPSMSLSAGIERTVAWWRERLGATSA